MGQAAFLSVDSCPGRGFGRGLGTGRRAGKGDENWLGAPLRGECGSGGPSKVTAATAATRFSTGGNVGADSWVPTGRAV